MKQGLCLLLWLCFCLSSVSACCEAEQTLVFPEKIQVIEAEAFYGVEGIDRVVLPEGIAQINSKAFAYSSISEIHLPASLLFIAENAFEGVEDMAATAPSGSYAYDWIMERGYPQVREFAVSASCNMAGMAFAGDTAIWTAKAKHGAAPYRYLFEVYRNNVRISVQSYSSVNSCCYTFGQAGTYYVTVKCKDDNGNIVSVQSDELIVTADTPVIEQVACSMEKIRTNDPVTFTVSAVGGKAPYSYAFSLEQNGTVIAAQEASSSAVFTHAFADAGEYLLHVAVTDVYQETAVHVLPLTVALRPVEVEAVTYSHSDPVVGEPMAFTVQVAYGKAPYTYHYRLTQDGNELFLLEASTENTFTYTFETVGAVRLEVSVSDSTGASANYETMLTVAEAPLELQSVTASVSAEQTGEPIVFAIQAAGGSKPLRYAFDLFVDGEEVDGAAFCEENTYTIVPDEPGVYAVRARVRDAEGNTLEMMSEGVVVTKETPASYFTFSEQTWTVLITGYKGPNEHIVIPSSIRGKAVTSVRIENNTVIQSAVLPDSFSNSKLAYNVFNDCPSLTKVVIPEGISAIGEFAFDSCTSLSEIVMPQSLRTIEPNAFYGCTSMSAFSLPDYITTIASKAFYTGYGYTPAIYANLDSETAVVLSSAGYSISLADVPDLTFRVYKREDGSRKYAVSKCASDAGQVMVPEWVDEIDVAAFRNCTSLSDIILPEGLEKIQSYAFSGCSSLSSIVLPEGLTELGNSAFEGCSSLTTMDIPVSALAANVLKNCSSLKTVTLAEGLTSIGNSAFSGCAALAELELPENLSDIGESAFSDCAALTELELPESLSVVGESAFSGCSALTALSIPEGITAISNGMFNRCTSLAHIRIPQSVVSIGDNAFANCTALTEICLPENVVSISSTAFKDCSLRVVAALGSATAKSLSDAGIAFSIPQAPELRLIYGEDENGAQTLTVSDCEASAVSVIIPQGVTEIAVSALNGCAALVNVVIPDTVTSIGYRAFYGCKALQEIIIPQSVISIGAQAFYGCSALTSAQILGRIITLENNVFNTCPSLSSVLLPDSLTEIKSGAFYYCGKLKSIRIPDGVVLIEANAFGDAYNKYTGIFYAAEDSAAAITLSNAGYSFVSPDYPMLYLKAKEASGIRTFTVTDCLFSAQSVVFPENVTEIVGGAFRDCSNLTSVTIPQGITYIGTATFQGCTGLTAVELPPTIQFISADAFRGCTRLETVAMCEGITSIGTYAFYGCEALQALTLPDSIETIGQYAFGACESLTTIQMPDSLEILPNYLFYNCSSLADVTLGEGLMQINSHVFSGCTALESLFIPDGLEGVSSGSFKECNVKLFVNRNSTAALTLTAAGYDFSYLD